MRSMPVVLIQPVRRMCGSLIRVVVTVGTRPFARCRLDKSFSFAIGAWSVSVFPAMGDKQSLLKNRR